MPAGTKWPDKVPFQFDSCREMVELCKRYNLTIADLVLQNEEALRDAKEVKAGIIELVRIMQDAVTRGIHAKGVLPGGLGLARRECIAGWRKSFLKTTLIR